MYKPFLLKKDFLSTLTPEALQQLTRGDDTRLSDAEELAEMAFFDHLTTHYEIEKELDKGKNILEYNRQISYPANAHFRYKGSIYRTLTKINGVKKPTNFVYWEEHADFENRSEIPAYTQRENYYEGDLVIFSNVVWKCVAEHGYEFDNIQLPGISGWTKAECRDWYEGIECMEWDCVKYNGNFYALMNMGKLETFQNPEESENWGMIALYDEGYNEYENSYKEYVVFEGSVWYPIMNVNSTELQSKVNVTEHDPRNLNIRKHMLRIAVYELHKLVSPHNVSNIRITDYEESMKWLDQASRLKINPNIPRKVDETSDKPITSWQVATFSAGSEVENNPYYF